MLTLMEDLPHEYPFPHEQEEAAGPEARSGPL